MQGKVKTVKSRGFGFIETALGIDFFFHQSQYKGDFKVLLNKIAMGEHPEVNFEQDMNSDNGPRALNVSMG